MLSALPQFMDSETALCPLDGMGQGCCTHLPSHFRPLSPSFYSVDLSAPLAACSANPCRCLASGPTVGLHQAVSPALPPTSLTVLRGCVLPAIFQKPQPKS